MELKTYSIKKGVDLHYLKTSKFKTNNLGIYINRSLTRDEVTINALLMLLLKRRCDLYPTTKELSIGLEEMYGARVNSGVRKKGDTEALYVNFEFVSDAFISENDVTDKILNLAKSMVFEQTCFDENYLIQEKENLKQEILSQVNDKRSYAQQRCMEIMCEDENYGLNELGYIDDIDAITCEDLLNHYKNHFLRSPIDIFICGDVDIDSMKDKIVKMSESVTVFNDSYPKTEIVTTVSVKKVTEEEQIAQGKLSMGFRTTISPLDSRYPALMICNSIFGSGPYSKLFNNVREKLSLCYYASSRLEMLKGLMFVNSGIEVANLDKAYNEILAQLKAVQDGDISDTELSAAKLGMVNSLQSHMDNALFTEDYYLTRFITGKIITIDDLCKQLQKVTKQMVVDVAKEIKLDTVYFLRGSEA